MSFSRLLSVLHNIMPIHVLHHNEGASQRFCWENCRNLEENFMSAFIFKHQSCLRFYSHLRYLSSWIRLSFPQFSLKESMKEQLSWGSVISLLATKMVKCCIIFSDVPRTKIPLNFFRVLRKGLYLLSYYKACEESHTIGMRKMRTKL